MEVNDLRNTITNSTLVTTQHRVTKLEVNSSENQHECGENDICIKKWSLEHLFLLETKWAFLCTKLDGNICGEYGIEIKVICDTLINFNHNKEYFLS